MLDEIQTQALLIKKTLVKITHLWHSVEGSVHGRIMHDILKQFWDVLEFDKCWVND